MEEKVSHQSFGTGGDPDVRKVASKYGDPDDLLSESWFPDVPGINTSGDYLKGYVPHPRRIMADARNDEVKLMSTSELL